MNKFKSFKMFLLVCIFILTIPLNAFAEEFDNDGVVPYDLGKWELVGEDNVIFSYTKETISDIYTATDGANFKIDITSKLYPSNRVSAIIYVNGYSYDFATIPIINYKGTLEFTGLPKGAKVFFYISVDSDDGFNFKFYD